MSTQTIFRTVGQTSQSTDISLVQKAAATSPGDPLAGLAYNTASLTAYSRRANSNAAPAAVTLATQTITGAWSSGGFVAADGTNAPGSYRFDIPNALLAVAGEVNVVFNGAANLATHTLKIIVTAFDLFSSINANLAAAAMTEAYPTMVGAVIQPMTVPQVLHAIHQLLVNAAASGTALTVKQLDQATTAMTFTLNDPQNASGIVRAT